MTLPTENYVESSVHMRQYLSQSKYIDFGHPLVQSKASALAAGKTNQRELVAACFEFVRDQIQHSCDYGPHPVTCSASEALIHGAGLCYAKSHLLAALLRANGVPAGMCYQRLSVGSAGAPYCLHGLNAVWLDAFGWHRLDARGNKPGVNAQFRPPVEQLAFSPREPEEADFLEIWPEPLPLVVNALIERRTVADVVANLPDIPIIKRQSTETGNRAGAPIFTSGEGPVRLRRASPTAREHSG
jgi:transglutaminase-like putative cysteine protease